jgi:hypothetical protein
MTAPYQPTSDFLTAIVSGDVSLAGDEFADANLQRLIDLTRDNDLSNRDWATMLLAQQDADTIAIRSALCAAADDEDDVVRAEAICGLAARAPDVALPLVARELAGETACMALFEAAKILAHPSLIDILRIWAEPSECTMLDEAAAHALHACELAAQRDAG